MDLKEEETSLTSSTSKWVNEPRAGLVQEPWRILSDQERTSGPEKVCSWTLNMAQTDPYMQTFISD